MGFPAQKVTFLADSVDLSLFEELPGKEECHCRLGFPLDRCIIGYIGRFRTLEREKGIPELIYVLSVNGAEPLLLCVGVPMDSVPTYLELSRRMETS